MQYLTDFADQGVTLPVLALILLTFALLGWPRGALAWVCVLGTALGLVLLLKLGLRACGSEVPAWLPGNPSGHVASATAIYGGLAAIALGRGRAALLPALLIAVVVAATRVGLGVHTVADVIAGALIGLAAALALGRLAGPRPAGRRWLAPLVALTVAAVLHGTHLDAEAAIRALAARLSPAITACTGEPPSAPG